MSANTTQEIMLVIDKINAIIDESKCSISRANSTSFVLGWMSSLLDDLSKDSKKNQETISRSLELLNEYMEMRKNGS